LPASALVLRALLRQRQPWNRIRSESFVYSRRVSSSVQLVALIRHARSIANDDPRLYKTMADHTIPLVRPADDPGAILAGRQTGARGPDAPRAGLWCRASRRCMRTEGIVVGEALGAGAPGLGRRWSSLRREQEFGDWDSFTEEEMAAAAPVRSARRQLLSDAF